ncbi:MAG TPA: threonine synthase [Verrucomicrobiota bacterium]|nr:threonine synthase [Verrucomicrobiota bacterium]HNU52933.1 threonine synthase [Verrucomicrobiota bacterium]
MSAIRFRSTNGAAPAVGLREALLAGQAPDRGLYEPERCPVFSPSDRAEFARLTYAEIAFRVLRPYALGSIPEELLAVYCREAYDFPVPIERVDEGRHVLRLDRGPTASFKDFAARMMARMLGGFVRETGRPVVILTATSGDTGSAVANAFHGIDGIRVLVLFPEGEVSECQRRQMTTLGGNIRTVAMAGTFDDCQALVKRAFADPELERLPLSSANSINIGRLLPQSVYYFYAASRLVAAEEPIVFSVPSGNFGDMMGAVLAGRMGLPLCRLVVPVNANDEFPRFLATGEYTPVVPSRPCLSNAMNVGHPSNLARLVSAYGGRMDEAGRIHGAPDLEAMRRALFSISVSDGATRQTILEAWTRRRLLLEPHGAVGWRGLLEYQAAGSPAGPAVVLETAHPAKFPAEMESLLGFRPEPPPALAALDGLPEEYDRLPADWAVFREYLLAWA